MSRTLIRGGCVLTMDRANYARADVLVDGATIAEIAPVVRARGAAVLEAEDCIVMPGFVDAHRQAWHALFRNAGAAARDVTAAHCRPDDLRAGTLAGLLGAAASGITTVVDWLDAAGDGARIDAVLSAHADSGLRTVLAVAGADALDGLTDRTTGPRTTLAWGAPAVGGSSADDAPLWARARAAGLRIHAPAGLDRDSAGSVASLADAGLLGPDVTLIHCTHLGDRDFDAIASSGAQVVLTPSTEMTEGIGVPPLQALVDRKIAIGLGVGSELESPGDLFAQMRAANSVQHARSFDLKLAGKGAIPSLLTTREVIRFGTVNGARAAGLPGGDGMLAPGAAADVVVLRADRPNIAPVNDPIGAVVWGMDTSNLDTVLVAGAPVVEHGALVADVAPVADAAAAARSQVASAAGMGTRR